tara:strand:+ start:336310 stop:336453 length:144 start_codon:yes stop_codon:yes gene_type:complete
VADEYAASFLSTGLTAGIHHRLDCCIGQNDRKAIIKAVVSDTVKIKH